MCRKTQPHTRTLGNFPEHLTYQVVSGIRLCNRDTNKRTAGSVGFAVLSEATPTSTLTPSKRSMSSSKIIGALLHAYASIVGVFAFATLPKPSCTRKRCADAHAHALRLSSMLPSLGPHGLSTGTCFRWCGLLMAYRRDMKNCNDGGGVVEFSSRRGGDHDPQTHRNTSLWRITFGDFLVTTVHVFVLRTFVGATSRLHTCCCSIGTLY